MKDTLVVIPYLAKDAQGDELTLAVTGWRKFFKSPHRIVIVGDHHPVVDTGDDITFIDCPRVEPVEGEYTPHIDHVHKFREVYRRFPESDGMIYTCDDIYPIHDIRLRDAKVAKMPKDYDIPEFDWKKETGWWRDLGKTRDLCRTDKTIILEYNWVCHLPVWYAWKPLLKIYDEYGCDRTSYIVENIYYNRYFLLHPHDAMVNAADISFEVKTANPGLPPLDETNRLFVSNANCGWSEKLEAILRKHYGLGG